MKKLFTASLVPAGLFGSVIGFINDILIVDEFASLRVLGAVAGFTVFCLILWQLNERVLKNQTLQEFSRPTCGFLLLSTLFVGVFYLYSNHFRDQGGAIAPKFELTASFQDQLLALNANILETQQAILDEVAEGKKEKSDNPRKELANLRIEYTPSALAEELKKNDSYAVGLFLAAGADAEFVAEAVLRSDAVLVTFWKALRNQSSTDAFAALAASDINLSFAPESVDFMDQIDQDLADELSEMRFAGYQGQRLCYPRSAVNADGNQEWDWCENVEVAPVLSLISSLDQLGLSHECWLNTRTYEWQSNDRRFFRRLAFGTRRSKLPHRPAAHAEELGVVKTVDGDLHVKTALCTVLDVDGLDLSGLNE